MVIELDALHGQRFWYDMTLSRILVPRLVLVRRRPR